MYLAYELGRSLVSPLNLWAAAVRSAFQDTALASLPLARPLAASAELLESATRRYEKPDLRVTVRTGGGEPVPLHEELAFATPFCRVLRFARAEASPSPRVLVVAPLSGHHASLVRETVEELASEFVVYLTDWVDAKTVPLGEGPFGLHDYIDLVRDTLTRLGPGTHVVAVCQPCVPVLAAVAVMAEAGDPAEPASMTLISGPIDARIAPTRVDRFATEHSLAWLEAALVYRVPPTLPGRGRRVYPGALQLQAFVSMDVPRHMEAHVKQFFRVAEGDEEAAAKHRRFYDEYFAVMDLPAEFYLETVREVFQEFTLPDGRMLHRGRTVRPAAIKRAALLTIEGENDDITGLGQTAAAHALCSGLPETSRRHHVQPGVGHYGTFSGRRWREEVAPIVREFIRSHAAST